MVKKMRILAFICFIPELSVVTVDWVPLSWNFWVKIENYKIVKYQFKSENKIIDIHIYVCNFKKLLFIYHYQYPSIIDVPFWTLLIGKMGQNWDNWELWYFLGLSMVYEVGDGFSSNPCFSKVAKPKRYHNK